MANLGDPVSTISYSDIGFPGSGSSVVFDPNSTLALTVRYGRLSVCDLQSGALKWHVADSPSIVVAGGCSTDSASVALVWGSLHDLHLRIIELAGQQETFVTGPGLFGNPVFSPDGQLLAYQDGSAASESTPANIVMIPASGGPVIWTAPGPRWTVGTFGGESPIVFSPDARLVGYRKSAAVVLLDAKSGRPTGVTVPAPGSWTFTADGRCVVTFGWQRSGWPTVTFTDVDTGLPIWRIELVYPAAVPAAEPSAVFTRDARRVAVMGANSFAVFDLPIPVPQPAQTHPLFAPHTFDAAMTPVVAFSAGGNLLKVANPRPEGRNRLRILDAATGETRWQRDSTGDIRSRFSPDGRYFAVWGTGRYDDDRLLDWTDVHVLTADDVYQPTDVGIALRFSRQQRFDARLDQIGVTGGATPLVVAVTGADPAAGVDPHVTMLRPIDAHPVRTVGIPGTVTAIACAPDAPRVAVGSGAGLQRVLHSDSSGPDWQARHGSPINAVAMSSTGRLIATASGDLRGRVYTAVPVSGENLANRLPLWSTVKHPQSVIRVAISADERWIVTGCADGGVRIFANSDGSDEHPVRHHIASNSRLRALTLGGTRWGAAGYADGTATVFDVETGELAATFWHSAPLLSVHFESAAALLITVTAAPDAQLRVWDVAAGAAAPMRVVDYRSPITDVAVCPSAPIVAAALDSGSVALLNIENGSDWTRLPVGAPVGSVEFDADGAVMAVASAHLLHIYTTS